MADDQDADDPAQWSVDHVIHELCRKQDPNWMDSGFSVPIPRANEIEKAFRDNDIDGDVLLQLDSADFHAMEIKSIGQINKLKRIIMFLRTRSRNYSVQLERIPSMTVMPTVEPKTSVPTALQQMPVYQPSRLHPEQSQNPSLKATNSPSAISHTSKSLAPNQFEITLDEPRIGSDVKVDLSKGEEEDTMLDLLDRSIDQQKAQRDSGVSAVNRSHTSRDSKRPGDSLDGASNKRQRIHASPADADSDSLQASRILFDVPLDHKDSDKDRKSNHSRSDGEFSDEALAVSLNSSELHDHGDHSFDRLLELYPVQDADDEEVLPLYGESDEDDREMTAESSTSEYEEERIQDSELGNLTEDHINQIIGGCIAEFVEDWKARKQDLVQKRAHQKWKIAADQPDLKEAMIRIAQKDHDHVQGRLSHLRQVLSKMQFSKADDVKKQCESLQVSVTQREEYSLHIRVLMSEEEPACPNSAQMKRPKTNRQSPDNQDILCESSDDDNFGDFISDDQQDIQVVIANQHDSVALHSDLEDDEAKAMNSKTPDDYAASAGEDAASLAEDVIMGDTCGLVQPSETPRRYTASDWYCGDADDEDGEGPLPLFKQDSSTKKRAAEGKIRNPLVLPISDDSSDARRPSHHQRSPLSSKAKGHRGGKSTENAIVLTSSPTHSDNGGGDENFEIHTPELNPADSTIKVPKIEPLISTSTRKKQAPTELVIPDLTEVAAIPWRHLINDPQNNQILALAKAISEVHEQDASILLQYILNLNLADMEDDLKEGLVALRSETDTDIVGVPKHKQDTVLLLTLLYISYILVRSFSEDEYLEDWEGDLAWNMIALTVPTFYEALTSLLRQRIDLARQAIPMPVPVSIEGSSLDDDDSVDTGAELTDAAQSKGKGRRQKAQSNPSHLRESLPASNPLDTQRLAKQRVADQEARKAVINHRLAQTSSQSGDIQIPVNFKEPLVMLDQHIAQRIKPHQISGVQFMWRELIEDTQQQGCLLAHTMGLGKTMQVISTLVTIAQCLRSSDPGIKAHIPSELHDLRILILSPPALSENWYDELMFWMPKHDTLGPICKITNRSKQPYYDIKQWSESGGVLLLGYDRLVIYTKTPSRTTHESEQQYARKVKHHEDMARWLFELPKFVIADEAHMLKNPTAKRAETAMKIKTMSRIALTGSPLSNHLEEYWAMINFIAPGYLGELSKFRQKFVEPINRCLSVESGIYDRRLGLRKMHVLKKVVDPKVNRADITAIKNDLPPKTEFFITVPLTDLQLEMYKVCVNYFRGVSAEGGLGKGKVASLLQWIAVLSLLCNHPWTFEQKLSDPERKRKHRKSHAEDAEDLAEEDVGPAELGAEDVDTTGQPTMLEAMKLALAVRSRPALADKTNIQDSTLSYRMVLVKAIIKESIRLHEKVLVFSHSLLTLDYMELVLADLKCPFERIDGGLATDKRQRAAKEFNAGTSKTEVFLISTRAGGLGLNLFGATRVIILDYSFNPSWEEQAIGRAYRIGQRKPVFVYRFKSGGTFEDVTFNQTIFKTQLFTRIIDHKAVLRKGSKVEAGRYLMDPSSPEMADFTGCIGKDPKIMDNVMQSFDCIRDIVLTETFAQDIDEGLTAVEIEEANQEIEDERLAREDPEAYHRRLAARTAQQYRTAQAHGPSVLAPHQNTSAIQRLAHILFPSSSSFGSPNFPGRPHERPTVALPTTSGRSSYSDETGPVEYKSTQQTKQ